MLKQYKINHSLLRCFLWIMLCAIPGFSSAQDKVYANAQQLRHKQADEHYRPLLDVLNDIKAHYDVSFLYEPVTLEDKKVKTPVSYRSKVENTLSRLLEPEGLTFKKINAKTYSILPQETAEVTGGDTPDATLTASISENSSMKELAVFETFSEPLDIIVSGVLTDESDNATSRRECIGKR